MKLLAKLTSVCDFETLVFSSLYVWAAPGCCTSVLWIGSSGYREACISQKQGSRAARFWGKKKVFFSFFLGGEDPAWYSLVASSGSNFLG